MSFSTRRASFLAAPIVVLVCACGDDGDTTGSTSSSSGGGSTQSTAEGPTSGPGTGSEDTTGTDVASSSDASSGTTTASGPATSSSSSSSSSSSDTSSSTGSCAPDCGGRECGTDGCGGTCGACDGGLACSSQGLCVPVKPGTLSFFVTSEGNLTGDFGGIAGADAYCQSLADAAGASDRSWRAYVSTAAQDARDRIGAGPWYDAAGALVADSVASLHANGLFYENAIDEHGELVPNGKTAPGMNEHDILTGSLQDGTFSGANCADLTSSSSDDVSTVGHCDASFSSAGGSSPVEPSDNWNATHATNGCDEDSLFNTGSSARLYCFAE